MNSPILAPVVVLVLWSLIMLGWMASSRLPAMSKARLPKTAGERTADLAAMLPKEVQWKADNYNHLMEQPTLFYALAGVLALTETGTGSNLILAWIYVGSRIIHSIVHSTSNIVIVRFSLFAIGTICLIVMAFQAALVVF
jgi:hypothetical protein